MDLPNGLFAAASEPPTDNVAFAVRDYLTSRWKELSPATQMIYGRAGLIIVQQFGSMKASEFAPKDVSRMQGVAPGIIMQVMNLSSACVNWLRRTGVITHAVDWSRASVIARGEWEAWTREDLDKINEYAGKAITVAPIIRDIIMLAAYTGMRRSDLFSIKPESVYQKDGKYHLTYRQSKTGITINMPLPDKIQDNKIIRRLAAGGEPFCGLVTNGSFYRNYKFVTRAAGVDKPFHGLRKLCATILAEAGCSMPELMSITGHESPTTAMKYIRSANKMVMTTNAIGKVNGS